MRLIKYLLLAATLSAFLGCAEYRVSSKVGENTADIYSAGMQGIDDAIESKSMERIQEKYKASRIIVTSYNRRVLVIGDAPTANIKDDIEHIIRAVPNVQEITNEITVGMLSKSISHRIDARITGNIKYNLGRNKAIKAGVVKIATSRGVVYLLGLVTHAEANAASDIASTTPNVKKVIRAFSYID